MTKRRRVNRETLFIRAVWLTFILLSAALLVCAYRLVRILWDYRESAESYQQIAVQAVAAASPAPAQKAYTAQAQAAAAAAGASAAPAEVPIAVDWDALAETNPEIVAWLYSADTPINYPVVQADDNEYYLTRGADRKKNAAGALFLDCRNDITAWDENFIIYGHRMKDDSMFGTIPQYAEESYYAQHPVMYLLTPSQSYRAELFACRTVHGEEKYFPTAFESAAAFQRYVGKAVSQSYWPSDTAIAADGPILTLVTCSTYTHADNPRLLVHGCLVPVS